jgi:Ser/Thr protein kinase RdoA (MazF antagonist)
MAFADLTVEQQVETMLPLARQIIDGFDIGECELESINHEYNSTFKVTATNGKLFALRINVNSKRTLPNLKAEIFWVEQLATIEGLTVPVPVKNRVGEYISTARHPILKRDLHAVLFSWLEGEELGDEPTEEMMRAAGRAMARMHAAARETKLPEGASLPVVDDVFWSYGNAIEPSDQVSPQDKASIARAVDQIETITRDLYARNSPQLIHADIHPWNVMWQGSDVAIFDFDDCVIGLPVQDIAVTLYYNDTAEQDAAFLTGYQEFSPLPEYTETEMNALKLQRRIVLLSYILETENPEHRAMVPKYLEETLRKINKTLGWCLPSSDGPELG